MKKLFNEKQTHTEKYIAQKITNLDTKFDNLTIDELAHEVGVSSSMIVKYAKNCGFSGFKELKYYVKNNRLNVKSVSDNYMQYQTNKIISFQNYIRGNEHLIDELARKIINSKYVVMYGHGPSLSIAKFFANRISIASKKPIIVQDDEQIIELELEKANNERLVIFLSASLNTPLLTSKLKQAIKTSDNYVVVYEDENYDIDFSNGIRLTNEKIVYDYNNFRDRTLFFLYFDLVFNKICEKIHDL